MLSKMEQLMISHEGIMVITGELKSSCWWGLPLGSEAEERRETSIFHLFVLSCSFPHPPPAVFCNFSKKFRNFCYNGPNKQKYPPLRMPVRLEVRRDRVGVRVGGHVMINMAS